MKQRIEDLETKLNVCGVEVDAFISCDLEITNWSFIEGDSGVPYNGGQNSPEPSCSESYEIDSWEVSACLVMFDIGETTIELEGKDMEGEQLKNFETWVTEQVKQKADWDSIGERFNEDMVG